MQCMNCGSQEFDLLPNGAGRCRYCGNIIPGMGRPAPGQFEQQINTIGTNFQTGKKDKIVALIITFFFGWCGGQYFYLGKPIIGVLNLIFCWTFIPSIWAIIHFFMLLGMSDQKFNKEYNTSER